MQVLVVEDEPRLAALLRQGLEEEGHSVIVAADGVDGLSLARSHPFDVILLDVMLPRLDGFSVVRRLRDAQNQTPILMLTARDGMGDIIHGLDAGADDYLTKPFAFEVLLARVRSVSRRGPVAQPIVLRAGELTLNSTTREVTRDGRPILLTRTEYNLLELLMRRAGTVISRDRLIEVIWGWDSEVQNNTLDAFIRLLRNKVDAVDGKTEASVIETARGVGYRLRTEK